MRMTLLSVAVAVVACAVSAVAQTQVPNYVFTEYSSTLLTVSVNGGVETDVPLLLSTPDQWSFDTGIQLSAPGLNAVSWAEPGDALHANLLAPIQLGGSLGIL